MAYISVDLDEYIDEFDDSELIDELKRRAVRKKLNICQYIAAIEGGSAIEACDHRNERERIAVFLGLNRLASKEDIINQINNRL